MVIFSKARGARHGNVGRIEIDRVSLTGPHHGVLEIHHFQTHTYDVDARIGPHPFTSSDPAGAKPQGIPSPAVPIEVFW